jgi:hypothetical protein
MQIDHSADFFFYMAFIFSQAEGNQLRVEFRSPVTVSRNRYEQQLMDYIVPPRCVPPEYQVRSPFFMLMSRIFFFWGLLRELLFLFYLSGRTPNI